MKSDEQIDAIMTAIPERWRYNWCGGERGPCACLGCVQIGNRAQILEKITGNVCNFDPEYINEIELRKSGSIYTDNKLTFEEWESWVKRNPKGDVPSGIYFTVK